jgi:hypothetical protein
MREQVSCSTDSRCTQLQAVGLRQQQARATLPGM